MRMLRTGAAIAALVVLGVAAFGNALGGAGGSTTRNSLTIVAGGAPGGGLDSIARSTQLVLREEGAVGNVQVVNIPGASGSIGLTRFMEFAGREDMLMSASSGMMGAISIGNTPAISDTTPIARLADDYMALVVPTDSEIRTLEDFLDVWRADTHGTSVAGGSMGSTDHLLLGMLAQATDIDTAELNYIAYAGGGEALSAMISGTTTAGISGYNEVAGQIEAGQLRALAISAPERLPGIDVPTFVEGGYDVTLSNWRGIVAAPGISPEAEAAITEIMTEMHASEAWAELVERNHWTDTFLTGEEFADFVVQEQQRTDDLIEELGL